MVTASLESSSQSSSYNNLNYPKKSICDSNDSGVSISISTPVRNSGQARQSRQSRQTRTEKKAAQGDSSGTVVPLSLLDLTINKDLRYSTNGSGGLHNHGTVMN